MIVSSIAGAANASFFSPSLRSRQSIPVLSMAESTRNSLSSRITSKALKTNDRVCSYPERPGAQFLPVFSRESDGRRGASATQKRAWQRYSCPHARLDARAGCGPPTGLPLAVRHEPGAAADARRMQPRQTLAFCLHQSLLTNHQSWFQGRNGHSTLHASKLLKIKARACARAELPGAFRFSLFAQVSRP